MASRTGHEAPASYRADAPRLRTGAVAALLAVFAFCLSVPHTSRAEERILSHHSDITIQRDAAVVVTETIRVRAEGLQIRRGITRDFPTRYRDRHGNRVRVDFEVLDVQRDGQDEPWRQESVSNGIRLYIGSVNRFLEPGVYEYRIRYRTNRQLGFFEEFDELYWNVTGTGSTFPTDAVSARVTLPEAVDPARLQIATYTGAQGEERSMAEAVVENDGAAVGFRTTAGLGPREGLTIAVGWPKGIVTAPSGTQKARWFLRDNAGALVLALAALALLGWYGWAWNRVGRDPEKGVIIPRYRPPEGLSPAACRYVRDMGFRRQAFTAAVVSLGVKGHLGIEEEDGDFTLRAVPDDGTPRPAPSAGEQALLDELLPGGTGSIELDQANHRKFGKARAGIAEALKNEYRGRLFNLNGRYLVLPVIIIIAASVLAAVFKQANPLIWVAWFLFAGGGLFLFIFLVRAPTLAGRRVMDEIEGFERYLETAEQERLDRMRGPALTPEVFEAFLPYAFALGVENAWVARFQREFPQEDPERGGYHPAWYHGDLGRATSLHHIGESLGSDLSGAIASASSPPGSSSGSGGGGFSGGGGGGGGTGGW